MSWVLVDAYYVQTKEKQLKEIPNDVKTIDARTQERRGHDTAQLIDWMEIRNSSASWDQHNFFVF